MKRFFYRHIAALPLLAALCAAMAIIGCDHETATKTSSDPSAPLTVAISPQSATILAGSSLTLSASISGWKSDSTVSWSLLGTPQGAQIGSLKITGDTATYIPPATITSNLTVTIQVRSNEDTAEKESSVITVQPSQVGPVRVKVTISPASVTLAPKGTQQFQATVSGSTNANIQWKVIGGVGSISPSGFYSAPDTLNLIAENVVVEAVSVADTADYAQSAVAVDLPSPCFRTVIWPILISHCTVPGCHNPVDHTHDLDFSTYAGVMATVIPGDTTNSFLHQRLNHFATSPDSQIVAINDWIETGAPYSLCEPNMADCDTTSVTYASFIAPTIATYCLGCHSERFASYCDSIDLSTYGEVQFLARIGQLMGVIKNTAPYPQMPEWGLPLDECVINKIQAWVNQGALNN